MPADTETSCSMHSFNESSGLLRQSTLLFVHRMERGPENRYIFLPSLAKKDYLSVRLVIQPHGVKAQAVSEVIANSKLASLSIEMEEHINLPSLLDLTVCDGA